MPSRVERNRCCWIRWILASSLVAVLGIASVFSWLYQASQTVPEFYAEALDRPVEEADQAGDEFERQVAELHNEVQTNEGWQVIFTDGQINGWLARDLRQKFPKLLPGSVHQPRIMFKDGLAHIACQVRTTKLKAVLSFILEPYTTDQPNEIAIRIATARAGRIPVPLRDVLQGVTEAARRSNVSVRWTQAQGDPVAVVQLPTEMEDVRDGVKLESLIVQEGQVLLSGSIDADRQTKIR